MFQKRRSMLGRRHLLAQQQVQSSTQSQPEITNDCRAVNTSWRGRSGKKKTPSRCDKASKEFKKKLFNQSPAVNYGNTNLGQDRNHRFLNGNFLNETGISSIPATPSSSSRLIPVTPGTAQQRRADMEISRYGPLPSVSRLKNEAVAPRLKNEPVEQCEEETTTFSYQKQPVTPGTSQQRRADMGISCYGSLPSALRLKNEFVEPQLKVEPVKQIDREATNFSYLKHSSASYDFDSLQPPDSPGPSRLDRIILEEKVEQPKDPDDLKNIESVSIQDPNIQLQFSPPLSSTCIGTPDSGKKNALVKEVNKESVQCSGRKLSVIQEDCDLSMIEFEQNERTVLELDETIKESTMNNTVNPNNVSSIEKVLKDLSIKHEEESEQSWENILSNLENMERTMINKAIKTENNIKVLKQQITGFQSQLRTIEKNAVVEFQENITNIRNMKKKLKSLKNKSQYTKTTDHKRSYASENKENNCSLNSTCQKNHLDLESEWFNSLKKDNPDLLKTPNPSRKVNLSSTWTPHSLTNVLHEQMNELYDE